MIYNPAQANPLFGNPLQTREHVAQALVDLFNPLLPHFSAGGARVRLDAEGAHFDRIAADLEGFARPLWGLVPYAAGGGEFAHWELYRQGLSNGADPEHPEYWGAMSGQDQRQVELAAIGFALRMIPEVLWEPLSQKAKDNLAAYLVRARNFNYVDNNWKFFRVLVDLGLERVGVAFDKSRTIQYLDELDGFYIDDGWYRDGNVRRLDHYIPFAMHFYGLIYAKTAIGDEARKGRLKERAKLFARDVQHWFDDEGGTIAFGRSLTYRFACAGFWGALAFADEQALPWGVVKGHFLRHLRWWSHYPIAHANGVLSIGYGYPNLFMSESYNSAGSPYWALKAFLPLALPADHPFWTAEEEAKGFDDEPVPLKHPGMVMQHGQGNVVALSCGQENFMMRQGAEKYAKFAYSSRYAFSTENDDRGFKTGAFDSCLAFSDDGLHYRVREHNETAQIAGSTLYSKWKPFADVTVDTWLIPNGNWHLRVHRISSPRQLQSVEGGFAISRADLNVDETHDQPGRALARSATDISVIVDLVGERAGRVHRAMPNTNLNFSKSLVPQLLGMVPAGVTVFVTAVLAHKRGGHAEAGANILPRAPSVDELEDLFAREGVTVSAVMVEVS